MKYPQARRNLNINLMNAMSVKNTSPQSFNLKGQPNTSHQGACKCICPSAPSFPSALFCSAMIGPISHIRVVTRAFHWSHVQTLKFPGRSRPSCTPWTGHGAGCVELPGWQGKASWSTYHPSTLAVSNLLFCQVGSVDRQFIHASALVELN